MTAFLAAIGPILTLVIMILKRIFDARDEAKAKNEQFELDQKKVLEIADQAIQKMKESLASQSNQAQKMDDEMEKDLSKKG